MGEKREDTNNTQESDCIGLGDSVHLTRILKGYNPINKKFVEISLNEHLGKTLILFFYPADFTYVCPTELSHLAGLAKEFKAQNAEILTISTDSEFSHKMWTEKEGNLKDFPFTMVSDRSGYLSKIYGCYNEDQGLAERCTVIISPKGKLLYREISNDKIGRSIYNILRIVNAINFTLKNPNKLAPADRKEGDEGVSPCENIESMFHKPAE